MSDTGESRKGTYDVYYSTMAQQYANPGQGRNAQPPARPFQALQGADLHRNTAPVGRMTSATRAKRQRRNGSRRSNRQLTRALNDWLHAAELESALNWAVHDAGQRELAEIAARAGSITEAVASTYGVTNDELKFVISERVTSALTIDAMTNAEIMLPGESETSETLDRTLATIGAELGHRAGTR